MGPLTMTHPIEKRWVGSEDQIDYGRAKMWLNRSVALLLVCAVAWFLSGLLMRDAIVQALGTNIQPPIKTSWTIGGMIAFAGFGFATARLWWNIATVLDPMTRGKKIAFYADQVKAPAAKAAPKTDSEVVESVDEVIERKPKKRDASWVDSDDLSAALG